MRVLGIDYGSKRVGIAVSNEDGRLAFPKRVFQQDKNLLKTVVDFARAERVSRIVMGESKDYAGKENPIMRDAKHFAEKIGKETGLPVIYEPEFLTSHQATQLQGKNDMLDASAAAIILQSYLDRHNSSDFQP